MLVASLMSEMRIRYNEMLVRLGKREILPVDSIRRIRVEESGEEMVELDEMKVKLTARLPKPLYLRKTVAEKLYAAADELKEDGLGLLVDFPYVSLETQREVWKTRLAQTRAENPNASEEEIVALNMMRVAPPDDDTSNASGHMTGGAVDLTLYELSSGEELDMGCGICEHNGKSKTEISGLNREQQANREKLRAAMEKQGLLNYPAEWWHYCYGDAMWSAYSGKKMCPYGYAGDILETQLKRAGVE